MFLDANHDSCDDLKTLKILGELIQYELRRFSTKRNIPGGAEFFFVRELSGRTNLKKTEKNSAPSGIFRLVENSLYIENCLEHSTNLLKNML